jgi:hypothetical protein
MRRAGWIVAGLATAVLTGWAGAEAPGRDGFGQAATIASGATKIARWELYLRSPRPGRRCVGMRAEQLWAGPEPVTRERCGARRVARRAMTIQTLAAPGMGSFAFGRAGRAVGQVAVTVGDRAPVNVATLPSPLGGRDRFWVVHAGLSCAPVTVQALGPRGSALGRPRSGLIGPRGCG